MGIKVNSSVAGSVICGFCRLSLKAKNHNKFAEQLNGIGCLQNFWTMIPQTATNLRSGMVENGVVEQMQLMKKGELFKAETMVLTQLHVLQTMPYKHFLKTKNK